MLIDYTEMSYKTASAVAKLMEVYAEHFPGETFYVGQNPKSGIVYMGFENLSISPFVNKSGDVMFEVFDYETGDVQEFETLDEAEIFAEKLSEESCLIE
jgi:hypothetical protein